MRGLDMSNFSSDSDRRGFNHIGDVSAEKYELINQICASPKIFDEQGHSNKKAIDFIRSGGKDSVGTKKRLDYGNDISLNFN